METMTDTEAGQYHSLALIGHLTRAGRRAAETLLDPSGLRPRHLIALTLLSDHGAANQQALAETLSLDPSNVVGLLNELEERGLITRRRHPEDRRRHIVAISTDGKKQLRAAQRLLAQVEDDVLRALSAEERATLHSLLMRAAGGHLPDTACTEIDEDCAE
jgi:DNA-binding MarR family transcriptional regulator